MQALHMYVVCMWCLVFIVKFGGVYMYSMNDVEELFGAGKVKIKFRKSIEPLSVF